MVKFNRVKEKHNISVTLYNHKDNHIVKIYDFIKGKVTYKKTYKNPRSALNFYEDIVIDDIKPDGTGLRGRYEYVTNKLNA